MRNIVSRLALALAVSSAAGCSDDSEDTMQGQNPATASDAAGPAPDAGTRLDCQPGYVERCIPTVGSKPIKHCSCVEVR
jgi:hypothetical protein